MASNVSSNMSSPAVVMAPPSEYYSPQKPVVAQSVKLHDAAPPPPRWLNLLMSVIFVFQAVVFFALSISVQRSDIQGRAIIFKQKLAAPIVFAAVFGIATIQLMRKRPQHMVRIGPPLAGVMLIPVTVLFCVGVGGWIFLGVCTLLFAALVTWRTFSTRKSFSYIDMVIHKSMKVVRVYIGHTVICMIGIILSAGLLFSFVNGISYAFSREFDLLGVLLLVSMYWTINVIRFLVGGIVFGTASLYYYKGAVNMPTDPSAKIFARVTSTVFGHMCIGAFLVPILEILHFGLGFFNYYGNDNNNSIISFLVSIVRFFNRYGFVQVVHQKKGFRQGSQDAWDILILNNVERLLREDPARRCVHLITVLGAALVATLSGIIMAADETHLIGLMLMASLYIGYSVVGVATIVFDASIISYYVNYAEDPNVLARSQPALFSIIRDRHQQYTHPGLASQASSV